MKIKAIFFDIDGTLIPLDGVIECLQDTCRYFKTIVPTKRELMRYVIGYKITEIMPSIIPETRDYIEEFTQYFKNLYVKNYKKYSELFPYVKDILSFIKKRKIKIGIITTKKRDEAKVILKGYELFYDILVSQDDVKKRKPDPEPVLKACYELRLKPEDCIFVGDHPFDMIAAKHAGCLAVGVLTGWGKKHNLKNAGADFVVKDLRSLKKLIE